MIIYNRPTSLLLLWFGIMVAMWQTGISTASGALRLKDIDPSTQESPLGEIVVKGPFVNAVTTHVKRSEVTIVWDGLGRPAVLESEADYETVAVDVYRKSLTAAVDQAARPLRRAVEANRFLFGTTLFTARDTDARAEIAFGETGVLSQDGPRFVRTMDGTPGLGNVVGRALARKTFVRRSPYLLSQVAAGRQGNLAANDPLRIRLRRAEEVSSPPKIHRLRLSASSRQRDGIGLSKFFRRSRS